MTWSSSGEMPRGCHMAHYHSGSFELDLVGPQMINLPSASKFGNGHTRGPQASITSSGSELLNNHASKITLPTPIRLAMLSLSPHSTRSRLTVDQRNLGRGSPFFAVRSASKNDITDGCFSRREADFLKP